MLLLLLGCASGEPEVLLTGWNYEWEELSHRIAYLRVGVDDETRLSLGLKGGDWSTGATFVDTPHYRVRYERVTSAGLTVLRGTATLLVGPEPTGSTTLTIDAGDLPAGRNLVAVIDGFSLDTDAPQPEGYPADYDPALGYASNGFGVALGDVSRDGDSLQIPVDVTVRWGPQDREDMNAAIPFAVTAVTVDVAVLAASATPDLLPVEAHADYEYDPPNTDQPPMDAAVAFDSGPREGIVAWRSFDLQGNLTGRDAGEGDYLRAVGAELVPSDIAASTWDGDVEATLSTSSSIEFTQLTADFSGELVRVGLPDVVAEHWVVTGEHPTGRAVTPPTASE
jgi:hypothetical protein